jgi:cyclopropane fatty-acyl-phospholipid synthase-like methyltransferase
VDLRAARYAELDFNSPLDSAHATELIAGLRLAPGALVVDLGCGWAR